MIKNFRAAPCLCGITAETLLARRRDHGLSRVLGLSGQRVEETIRFHLRHQRRGVISLWKKFDRFQLAGLALICLKNEMKADAERALRDLISTVARMC